MAGPEIAALEQAAAEHVGALDAECGVARGEAELGDRLVEESHLAVGHAQIVMARGVVRLHLFAHPRLEGGEQLGEVDVEVVGRALLHGDAVGRQLLRLDLALAPVGQALEAACRHLVVRVVGARLDEPLVRVRRLLRREREVAELAAHRGRLDPLLAALAVGEPQAVQALGRLRTSRQLVVDRGGLLETAHRLPGQRGAQERLGSLLALARTEQGARVVEVGADLGRHVRFATRRRGVLRHRRRGHRRCGAEGRRAQARALEALGAALTRLRVADAGRACGRLALRAGAAVHARLGPGLRCVRGNRRLLGRDPAPG